MNKQNLNLLILEDNPDDAELMVRELKKEGFVLEWKRVETEKTFRKALAEKPDFILSDYNLPSFHGMAAIKIHQALTPEIPLIIVSDMMSGDLAVECIKAGATDYVHKKQLSRLNPVVKRALNEAEAYSERKKAEEELKIHRDHLQELVKEQTSELRESEEKYRTLTENLNVGFYRDTVGPKGKFIEMNPALIKMFGYKSREDVLKLNVSDLYQNPEERKNFNRQILENGFVQDEELNLIKKDGSALICSVSAVAIKDKNGKVKFFDGIIDDITERKQAEEALKKSEEKYRQLAETAKDVIIVLDLKGNVKYINHEGINLCGYSKEEIFKMNVNQVLPADKIPVSDNNFARRIAGDKSLLMYEIDFVHKKGNKIPVEIKSSLITEQGKPSGVLIIARDITERKQAEEALRESEEKFRSITCTAQDAIVMVDNSGNISYWNKSAKNIFGYPEEEVIGRELHKLLAHKKYYRDSLKGLNKFKETGKGPAINKTLEFTGIKKDKTEFPLELSLSSVKLKGKWSAIAIIRDITERRKAQYELKNYANTQKVLLQEVNHRVKNNLTAILGLLQIQEAKIKNKAYLTFINEFKGRIYGLSTVHSLLTKSNWQPLNLNLLCNKIINASIDCLHCSNITDINISPSTVLISSNQAYHLTLVINELITNSLKYGKKNKHKIHLNVDIKKNKENIIITYRDTGKGYPKRLIEKNFSNTGVGFDLIKGIVTHSLNGELQIYNDNGAVTVIKFKPDKEM